MASPPKLPTPETPQDGGFLSRWSRRKVQRSQGEVPAEPAPMTQVQGRPVAPDRPGAGPALADPAPPASAAPDVAVAPPPPPTLADVASLNRDSDYARFVLPGVDGGVRNAALKKLFTDPHFNVMDGLDTYIDDYGLADPLPAGMLRQLAQSQSLGLFDHEKVPVASAGLAPDGLPAAVDPAPAEATCDAPPDRVDVAPSRPLTEPSSLPDEDADLRLQPHAAAGPTGAGAGPESDAGRQR